MKKSNNTFTILLGICMSIYILFSGIAVQAQTIEVDNNKKDFTTKPTKQDLDDLLKKYPMLKNAGLEKQNLLTQKQLYVNYVNDGTKTTKSYYTKDQYIKMQISDNNLINSSSLITPNSVSITPPPRSNSWMRLTLNIYSNDRKNYDIYGFYQWLSAPNKLQQDAIGISHGPGLTFTYGNGYADICNPYGGFTGNITPYTEEWKHLTYYGTPSKFKGQVGGTGTTFQLGHGGSSCGFQDGTVIYPYGLFYASAKRSDTTTTSTEIVLTYDHQSSTISIEPALNIPLGGTMTFTNTTSYTPFDLGYNLGL